LQANKILSRVDKDADGTLSFDEFEAYFRRTCKSIEKFRKSHRGTQ
jgi:Ca2+-binding EF-hand superfamily protein